MIRGIPEGTLLLGLVDCAGFWRERKVCAAGIEGTYIST